MHWKLVLLGALLVLGACNNDQERHSVDAVAAASLITGVAWNERVEIRDDRIPASPARRLRVTVGGNPPYEIPVVFQADKRLVFDLPAVPGLPSLPTELPALISFNAYNQTPSPSQQAAYTSRGNVLVQVLNPAGQEVFRREYSPYGAVVPGQLTLIKDGPCVTLPAGFSELERRQVSVGGTNVCYVTAGFSTQGTAQAITALTTALPGVSADKDTVSGLDQASANAFDPSCEQIARWLNLSGQRGFSNIDMAQLEAYTNAQAATVTGAGVDVFVVGGGLGASDGFKCPAANMEGHDTHVADIIRALAPGANIQAREVCNDQGSCPASKITQALLEIAGDTVGTNQETLINLSLGSPLANTAMFRALQLLQNNVLVVASAGNAPYAPRHFPASYSSSLPTPGLLSNVIAVGASGLRNANWGFAGFNTRRNGEIASPAVSLCPDSALAFRCKGAGSGALQEIGITGTSFATSAVVGTAALYLEQSVPTLSPVRLRQCLNNYSRQNPNLDRMVWFDPAGC